MSPVTAVVVFFLCLGAFLGGYGLGFLIGRQVGFVAGLRDEEWKKFKSDFDEAHK